MGPKVTYETRHFKGDISLGMVVKELKSSGYSLDQILTARIDVMYSQWCAHIPVVRDESSLRRSASSRLGELEDEVDNVLQQLASLEEERRELEEFLQG